MNATSDIDFVRRSLQIAADAVNYGNHPLHQGTLLEPIAPALLLEHPGAPFHIALTY